MDNPTQEKIELEVNQQEIQQESQSSIVDDIQFEEVFDADKIQNELKTSLGLDVASDDIAVEFVEVKKELSGSTEEQAPTIQTNFENEIPDDSDIPFDISILEKEIKKVMDAPVKFDSNSKKYVVYVDSDNIDFMESLSIKERQEIINRILKEQNEFIIMKKITQERIRFTKHALLATITFIVGFPVLFFCVNRALQITIDNYNVAKQNFSQLYRSSGKIHAVNSRD